MISGIRFMRKLVVGLVVPLLALPVMGSQVSAAQDVPSSRECEIRPQGLLDLLGMLNDVEIAQYSGRLETIGESEIAPGKALTSEDAEAIAWTARQLVACANGLDPLRVMPLFSENLQAALVAGVANVGDLGDVFDDVPLLASDTLNEGGLPALVVVNSWYDAESTHRIWAQMEVPVTSADATTTTTPRFLVSFVYDEYLWVIDSIWGITS